MLREFPPPALVGGNYQRFLLVSDGYGAQTSDQGWPIVEATVEDDRD
jgi:hypothetical protein